MNERPLDPDQVLKALDEAYASHDGTFNAANAAIAALTPAEGEAPYICCIASGLLAAFDYVMAEIQKSGHPGAVRDLAAMAALLSAKWAPNEMVYVTRSSLPTPTTKH